MLDGALGRADALQRAIHQHHDEPMRIGAGDTTVRGHGAVGGKAGIAGISGHVRNSLYMQLNGAVRQNLRARAPVRLRGIKPSGRRLASFGQAIQLLRQVAGGGLAAAPAWNPAR